MAVECRSVVWMYGVYGSAISRRHISCAYLYRWLGIGTPHVNAVRCRSHISYHGSEISFPPINVEFIANSIETSPIVATSTYKRLCEIGKQKQIKWTGRWEKKQNKCDEENSSLVVSVCVCVSLRWIECGSAKHIPGIHMECRKLSWTKFGKEFMWRRRQKKKKRERNEDKNPERHRNFSSHQCQTSNILWSIYI